jgi:hypothetical protein
VPVTFDSVAPPGADAVIEPTDDVAALPVSATDVDAPIVPTEPDAAACVIGADWLADIEPGAPVDSA